MSINSLADFKGVPRETEDGTKNQPSEMLERIRHSAYEKALIKERASTQLVCPDRSDVELCFDKKSLASLIADKALQNGV